MKKPCEIQFANDKVKNAFEKLDDPELKKFLDRAFKDICNDPFCGMKKLLNGNIYKGISFDITTFTEAYLGEKEVMKRNE